MKKKCFKCLKIKNLSLFYKRSGRANKVHSYCKECFNDYCMDRWKEKKIKAVVYKGGKCFYCNYDECIFALEFHHIDPNTKEFDWKKLRLQTEKNINKELDKCILLCANCHRKLHHDLNI